VPKTGISWPESLKRLIAFHADVGGTFTIEDLYSHESSLARRYPDNRHIRETIRDKVQDLRNEGYIEFLDNQGTYRRLQ
jgi:hypothetical protein